MTEPDAQDVPQDTRQDVSQDVQEALQGAPKEALQGAPQDVQSVSTGAGEARITWHRATSAPRLVLALGHGAGGSAVSRDLAALAAVLPAHAVTVALVDQPWRVAGKKLAPAPKTLDTGWRGVWPVLTAEGVPVVAAGRSAGARVACRTARELGARAVLALAFPLHAPGRPERSRAAELLGAGFQDGIDTLVVQGARDTFGRLAEFPDGPYARVEVPYADHGFAVPKTAPVSQDDALRVITQTVTGWTAGLV